MSNYNSLKTTIDANIKQNGNQEITGQILNSVLNQMVTTLGAGYQFAGIATIDTNPGTPDAKVFYIANGKGTYEKFGGINVTEDEVVVLYWDSSWHKVSTGIASQEKLSELEESVTEVIGEDLTLSTTGGGSEWKRVTFRVDGRYPYTLKVEGITDASDEGTLFLEIITTTNGKRSQKYTVSHGGTIEPSYVIPENTTIIEVLARFHTNETMLATLSHDGDLGSIKKEVDILKEQVEIYDELDFIVGTIYQGRLVSSTDCLSCLKYIAVKPNQQIRFILGDSLSVRISEYDSTKTFIKSTGYDRFTSLILGSTTSFIQISLNYAGRGYGSSNPITIEAYSTEDFKWPVAINTDVVILREKQGEMNNILLGKQDIINGTRNLYDASTAIDGYLDSRGIVLAGDVKATDFIYCYGEQKITTNYGGRSNLYLCFYDKDKSFLSSVLQYQVYTFDIPDEAVYFRANMSAYTSTNMIVFGDTMPEYEPHKGLDYIFSHLVDHEETISNLNSDKSTALAALRNAVPNRYGYANRNLFPLFSIATDIHTDWDRLKRVLEYSEKVGVNSILCLGDIGDQQAAFDAFDWQNFVLGASIPVLTIPGNHEFVYNAGQTLYTGYTDETIAAKIYNEALVAHNGETHPNGKNYWHKDISYSVRGEDKILRIIGIYQYEFVDAWENGHPVHTQNTTGKDMPYYKQEQIDWLVGLLDSADSNTDVVILMHHAPTNNLERVDNAWNPEQSLGINIISGVSNNTNNDFIPQIIDAWINGTSVNKNSTMANDDSVISVNHTFSSTHHGKFVGYITGHSHYDAITKIIGMEEQYVFCNTCTTAANNQQGGDLPRDTSGKLQDSFNIIAYDCIKHRVGIVKIGSDVSVDMRDKKYTCNFIL